MKRSGERGAGEFAPISWDEALDTVAKGLRRTAELHGSDAVAFARTSGASQMANYSSLQRALGASQLFGSVDMAVHMGLNTAFGFKGLFDQSTNEWTDRPNSRTILVWGHNPAETSMTVFRWLLDARDAGTRLIVIDPRYSATAMHADWWVAPHPGTDAALTLGMLHVIVEEGLVDEEFALAHTCGPLLVDDRTGRYLRESDLLPGGADDRFVVWNAVQDAPCVDGSAERPVLDGAFALPGITASTAYRLLRTMLSEYPPERVSEISGVSASDVRDLARTYATESPSIITYGYGVDRYLHGDLVTRAGAAMAMVTGNLGRPGAGVGVASHGIGFRCTAPPATASGRSGRSIPNSHVGQQEIGVRALFTAGDYLNQRVAEQTRALDWLRTLDLVVVVDHFWNTTSQWADIVLPASTFLEGEPDEIVDLQLWGNGVFLKRAVIEPLHQSRPDLWIERELAARLEVGPLDESAEQAIRRRLDTTDDPLLAGISLDAIVAAGGAMRTMAPTTPNVQYEDLRFGTASGRAEFYSEDLVVVDEALPIYRGDHEASPTHPLAGTYPLVFTQTHARQRAHSTFSNNRWMLEVWPEPRLELNPHDAAARGVEDEDLVEVFNDRGHVLVKAVLNPDYPPGLCNITEGWKRDQFVSGHLQELVNGPINAAQELLWHQSNLPFSDTRVEVRRADRGSHDAG